MEIKECESYYWIYSLEDPFSKEVKYIGITNNPKKRLYEHLKDDRSNKHKHNWLRQIEYSPTMIILGMECTLNQVRLKEKEFISYYRNKGNKLVNKTNGGDYVGEHIFSKEHLENIRIANKKNNKKVYQYDLEGNYLDEFDSITIAANAFALSIPKISQACYNKIRKSTGGYQWRFEKFDKIEKYGRPERYNSKKH